MAYLEPPEPFSKDEPLIVRTVRIVTYPSHWKEFEREASESLHPRGRYLGFLVGHHVAGRLQALKPLINPRSPEAPENDENM